MALHRIEVHFLKSEYDVQGKQLLTEIHEDLHISSISAIRTAQVYLIDGDLPAEDLNILGHELFTDPVVQYFTCDQTPSGEFSYIVEVGFKPGVTDNTAQTAEEGITDVLGKKVNCRVYTVRQFAFYGPVTEQEIKEICERILYNPIIEYYTVRTTTDYKYPQLKIGTDIEPRVAVVDLNVSDEDLMEISRKGVFALNLQEMKAIQSYFKTHSEERIKIGLTSQPTDIELEMFAQTWSEHCKHKIFNAVIHYTENQDTETISSLFNTYIQKATKEISRKKPGWLVSVFSDNAGIIRFTDDTNIAFKVETHNHPSAIEPYGGAITGIVGVNRDIMGAGLGAYLLFNTDIFCFAPPDYPREQLPSNILHPRRILKGVRKGVEHGGNKIGIPTVNGAIIFDDGYLGNPLVYCGTGGIIPHKVAGRIASKKRIVPGDLVIMVGGRIGKDGIHGATFSSQKLDEETSAQAVQIGAPIVQKRMMEVLLSARDSGMINAITDNGAGGLSSSVGEMAELSGGCRIELEKAPVKYAGLVPWELWVSEAQERMTVAVPPDRGEEFLELCRRYDVEATILGIFTDSGKIHVTYNGKTVVYLDIDYLHKGLPQAELHAVWNKPEHTELRFKESADLTPYLKKILSDYTVCSKESVVRQYDHEVQGGMVIKPMVGITNDGPGDAGALHPVPEENKGIVISNGINPRYGLIDTYWMAASAIDEAIRNIIAVGGNIDKIALLDNFCWGNPIDSPENPQGKFQLGQLVRAARACYDVSVAYGTPFISGKDSFHNEYKIKDTTYAIPPTLLISAVGIIDDYRKAITMDAKESGDLVYVVGETYEELGGSMYFKIRNAIGNNVPAVRTDSALKLYKAMNRLCKKELAASIHDCSEGGIGVALAETAFAGGLGMDIHLELVPSQCERNDYTLFSESNSRFIVTVHTGNQEAFESCLKGITFAKIGKVRKDKDFIVSFKKKKLIDTNIDLLKKTWQQPLSWV